ncbi:Sodium channel protein 60E [Trichoplax sp. H2]|nr:Sodium channel protein 60E [Trichoplax sp. H2]|eukprot:RDD37346.1 Sodium channel protein 60E [Trichoplax sp. H2]
MLVTVLSLTLYFLCGVSLLGVQLFMGILTRKCCKTYNWNQTDYDVDGLSFDLFIKNKTNWLYSGGSTVLCSNSSINTACPSGYSCYEGIFPNPEDGLLNFDNFLASLYVNLQIITQDQWDSDYQSVLKASNTWYFFYFLAIIFLGSDYLLNLILAVVSMAYSKQEQLRSEQQNNFEKMVRTSRDQTTIPYFLPSPPHLWYPPRRKNILPIVLSGIRSSISLNSRHLDKEDPSEYKDENKPTISRELIAFHNHGNDCENGDDIMPIDDSEIRRTNSNLSTSLHTPNMSKANFDSVAHSDVMENGYDNPYPAMARPLPASPYLSVPNMQSNIVARNHWIQFTTLNCVVAVRAAPTAKKTVWKRFRKVLLKIVQNVLFEIFIMSCVLADFVVIAISNPLEPKFWESMAEYVFAALFFVEMILKLIALSPRCYVKDSWNILDGVMTITGLVDVILILARISSPATSALKTLRVFRIFKLAKAWKAMRRLLTALGNSMTAIMYVGIMVLIYLYIFAVMGMKLFKKPYEKKFGKNQPRFNFDTLPDACILIFRILCGEWSDPISNAVKATNSYASITFFVVAYVIGNLLVLNLFLALLLSSLEDASEDDNNSNGTKNDEGVSRNEKSSFFQKFLGPIRNSKICSLCARCHCSISKRKHSLSDSDHESVPSDDRREFSTSKSDSRQAYIDPIADDASLADTVSFDNHVIRINTGNSFLSNKAENRDETDSAMNHANRNGNILMNPSTDSNNHRMDEHLGINHSQLIQQSLSTAHLPSKSKDEYIAEVELDKGLNCNPNSNDQLEVKLTATDKSTKPVVENDESPTLTTEIEVEASPNAELGLTSKNKSVSDSHITNKSLTKSTASDARKSRKKRFHRNKSTTNQANITRKDSEIHELQQEKRPRFRRKRKSKVEDSQLTLSEDTISTQKSNKGDLKVENINYRMRTLRGKSKKGSLEIENARPKDAFVLIETAKEDEGDEGRQITANNLSRSDPLDDRNLVNANKMETLQQPRASIEAKQVVRSSIAIYDGKGNTQVDTSVNGRQEQSTQIDYLTTERHKRNIQMDQLADKRYKQNAQMDHVDDGRKVQSIIVSVTSPNLRQTTIQEYKLRNRVWSNSMPPIDSKSGLPNSEKNRTEVSTQTEDLDNSENDSNSTKMFEKNQYLTVGTDARGSRNNLPNSESRARLRGSTSSPGNIATIGKEYDRSSRNSYGPPGKDNKLLALFSTEREVPYYFPCFLRDAFHCQITYDWRLVRAITYIRRKALLVLDNNITHKIILLLIVMHSVLLIFNDKTIQSNQNMKKIIFNMDYYLTIFFTVELALEFMSFGPTSFCTSPWKIVDVIIVALSFATYHLDLSTSARQSLEFNIINSIRPIRIIPRLGSLQVIVAALVMSIPSIVNVFLVCSIFWLIFAITGVQLFAGTFGRCLINVDNSTLANVTNKTECDNMGYYWRNPVMNFDNLGNALISLFHIATLDGWKRLMKSAVDARGKDLQPKSLNSLPARLFFIAFIFVGVFLTLNLIAGVIIDQFYSSRKKINPVCQIYCQLGEIALLQLVISPILASITGIVLSNLPSVTFRVSPAIIRAIRIFRIVRMIRLLRHAQGMRRLLMALIASIPALFNIAILIAVVSFIYAIIGMSVFNHVKYHGVITKSLNFENFITTSIILVQLSTAAGWTDFHHALSIQPPKCTSASAVSTFVPTGNCGSPHLATIYIISYILLTWFVLINLFVAVILSNYQDCVDADSATVSEEDISTFFETWAKYDPEATQFIHYEELSLLLNELPPPFGTPIPNIYVCISLNLPVYYGGNIHCLDVIAALLSKLMEKIIDEISQEFKDEYEQLLEKIHGVFHTKFPKWSNKSGETVTSRVLSDEVEPVILLRSSFRRWKALTYKRRQGYDVNFNWILFM